MAGIGLLALLWGRPVAGVTALCAAVIVALSFDPTMSHSIGFALSVVATLGLLVLGQPISSALSRWVPPPVALALAVPLSAAIACQPIILVMSPFLPTYGILANILAEPLVPIATVCGMLAVVFAPIPFLADGVLWVATAVAGLIATIARTLAALPGARIPWPAGWVGVVCATTVSIGVCLAVTVRWRRVGLAIIAAASVVGLSMTVGAGRIAWATAPAEWSWAQCDVGQGDAVVIRSAGSVALIDTGRAEPPLRECLRTLGVGRIDLLVITHFDIDHVGGYGAVLGSVGTVLHGPTDGIADEVILNRLRENGARLVDGHRGMTGSLGRMTWRVLWPTPNNPREPGNPSSVTLMVTPGPACDSTCVSGLDLGDLPAAEQSTLLSLGGVSPVDVVKVSHHGSRDQDPDFYRRVRAIVGLIGVGADNDYGHPTADALDMLAGTGTTVVRSDLNGIALVWRTATGQLRVWRERATDPGFTMRTEE
jgi:competence protein ComEC